MLFRKFSIFFIFCLIGYTDSPFAQQRKLRVAVESIRDGKFGKATDKITQYENKEGVVAATLFLRSVILLRAEPSIQHLDSSYQLLTAFYQKRDSLLPIDKEELCKTLEICDTTISKHEVALQHALYQFYAVTMDTVIINRFLSTYIDNSMYQAMRSTRDSLVYEDVIQDGSSMRLEYFIDHYQPSSYTSFAEANLFNLFRKELKENNDPNPLKRFLDKYPNGAYSKEALELIAEDAWGRISSKKDTSSLRQFIQLYAGSTTAAEAENLLADQLLRLIESSQSAALMNQFLNVFPLHSKSSEVRARLRSLSYPTVPYLVQANQFKLLNTYDNSFVNNQTYREIIPVGKNQFIARIDCQFGVVDGTGEVIIPFYYHSIIFERGFFRLGSTSDWGMANRSGELIFPVQYHEISFLNDTLIRLNTKTSNSNTNEYRVWSTQVGWLMDESFQELEMVDPKHFIVKDANYYFLINDQAVQMSSMYDAIRPMWVNNSKSYNGLVAELNSKKGVLRPDGSVFIPFKYKDVTFLSDRYYSVTDNKDFVGVIDTNGNEIIPFKYHSIGHLVNNLFSLGFKKDKNLYEYSYRLYDAGLRRIVSAETFCNVNVVTKNRIVYCQNEKFGLMNYAGKKITPPFAGNIESYPLSDSLFIYQTNDQYGLMDLNGKFAQIPSYDYLQSMEYEDGGCDDGCGEEGYFTCEEDPQGKVVCDEGSTSYFINDAGATSDDNYDYGNHLLKDSLLYASKNGKYGYLNSKGQLAIPFRYDLAQPFQNGFANVSIKMNSHNEEYQHMVIDKAGNIRLNGYHISYFTADNKYAVVEKNQYYSIWDYKQNYLINFSEPLSHLSYINNSVEIFYSVSFKNNEVYISMEDGHLYMNKSIDFSSYDYNQQLISLSNKLDYEKDSTYQIIQMLNMLEQNHQNDCKLVHLLARAYVVNKDSYRARLYFQRLINLTNDQQSVYNEWANFEYENKNWSNFVELATNLLSTACVPPNDYGCNDMLFKKAYALHELGRYAEAFSCYSQLITRDPQHYSSIYNRGIIYSIYYNNTAMAYSEITRAISLCPKSDKQSIGLFYCTRGNILYQMRRYSEACSDWRMSMTYGYDQAKAQLQNCR